MGGAASVDIKHEVKHLLEGKPKNAAEDIKDLATAQIEITKFRKLAEEFLNDCDKNSEGSEGISKPPPLVKQKSVKANKLNRQGIMDKGDAIDFTNEVFVPKVIPKSDKVKDMLLNVVSKNILFMSYTKEEHMAIIDAFESIKYQAEDLVIRQGDKGDYFFIVETGYLDIYVNKKSADGIGAKVGMQQGPAASFGELALMYDTPRAASIVAATESVLWRISRNEYKSIIIHSKFMRNKMYIELIQNVEVTGKRLGSYLAPDAVEKLAITMEREVFNPNEVIIRQGNKGNNFYIIVEGEVDVYKTKPMSNGMPSLRIVSNSNENFKNNPKEELVATLKKGQYFGEKALLQEDVRQASCVSKTDVVCLTLGRDDFISMIGRIDELDKQKDSPTTRSLKTHNSVSPVKSELGISGSNPAPAAGSKQPSDDKSKHMLNSLSTPTLPPKNDTPVQPVPAVAEKVSTNAEVPSSARDPFAKIDRSINLSNMKMMRIIGRGAFGHVKLATYVPPNSKNEAKEYYALKCQSKSAIVENGLKKHVLNEMFLMLKINHPFIVRLYSAAQDDYYLYFVLELLPGGELFSYLQVVNIVSENDAKFYAGAIVSAFTHIHQSHLRIAYRDLKPENIVLTAKGYPKLVDFGLAKQVPLGKKTYTMCGTPDYLSPEIILNQGHDIAVDYWCLGIFICELVTGEAPFQADSTMEIYENILNSQPRLPTFLSRNIKDLVFSLLKTEQGKRLGNARDGIAGLIGHKWFGNFNWKKLESEQLAAPYVPKVKSPDDMSNFDKYDEDEPFKRPPCGWSVEGL